MLNEKPPPRGGGFFFRAQEVDSSLAARAPEPIHPFESVWIACLHATPGDDVGDVGARDQLGQSLAQYRMGQLEAEQAKSKAAQHLRDALEVEPVLHRMEQPAMSQRLPSSGKRSARHCRRA